MRKTTIAILTFALILTTSMAFGESKTQRSLTEQKIKRIQGQCTYHGGLNKETGMCKDGSDPYADPPGTPAPKGGGCSYHGGYRPGNESFCADGTRPNAGDPPLSKPVPKELRDDLQQNENELDTYIQKACESGDESEDESAKCKEIAMKEGQGAELREKADEACRRIQKYDPNYNCYVTLPDTLPAADPPAVASGSDSGGSGSGGSGTTASGSGSSGASGSGGSSSSDKPKPSAKPPTPKQAAAAAAKAEKAKAAAAAAYKKAMAARCKAATSALAKTEKSPDWKKIQASPSFGKSYAECATVTDPKWEAALSKKCDQYVTVDTAKYEACEAKLAKTWKGGVNTPDTCRTVFMETEYWQKTIATAEKAKKDACFEK